MRVMAFGTFDTSRHPRVGVLIEALRAAGVQVVVANRPLGFSTAERVRLLAEPWRLPLFAWRLLTRWAELASDARSLGTVDAILVGYMGHFDVLFARLLRPRAVIVLDHLISAADTAKDRGSADAARQLLLGALDRAATMAADVVLVDTDDHVALVPGRARARTTVVPVGAGADWFAVRAQEPHGRLRAVFFGLFTPLQGTTTIGEALGLLADAPVDVTMIGTGQDYAAAQAAAAGNPHVTWIDWVDSADLPAVVADHQVCLGIVGTGAKALRVVPNKVYQGAAAGCAIVTSDTAPQRQALGDAAVFVPPGDGAALATELRALASDPARVADLQAAARSRAKARFSAEALGDELVTAITAARQARLGAAMGQ